MVALFDQEMLYCGRDRRVGFEILRGNRLDLAISGNDATDGTALNADGSYFERSLVKI
jgi:hypothetical protein